MSFRLLARGVPPADRSHLQPWRARRWGSVPGVEPTDLVAAGTQRALRREARRAGSALFQTSKDFFDTVANGVVFGGARFSGMRRECVHLLPRQRVSDHD